MGGQYSLPFTAAVALTRDMSNPLVYDDAAVKDPLVRSLAKNMELIIDKQRNGLAPQTVRLVFEREMTRFKDPEQAAGFRPVVGTADAVPEDV